MAGAPVLGADLLVQCYLFTPTLLNPESLVFAPPGQLLPVLQGPVHTQGFFLSSSPLFP